MCLCYAQATDKSKHGLVWKCNISMCVMGKYKWRQGNENEWKRMRKKENNE